jgi:integrase
MEEPIAPLEQSPQSGLKPQQPMRNEIPLALTAEEVTQLWRSHDIDLSPLQLELLPLVQRWLGRRRKNSLANLLVGNPIEEVSPQITKELTADVLSHFKPRSRGIAAAALMTKIIDRGNRENITVSLCPPPIAILIKSQSSPFQIDRWATLELAGKMRILLKDALSHPVLLVRKKTDPETVARIALGQTLVSAILHGGLVGHASLTALLTRINEPKTPLYCLGDRLFIELSLTQSKQENAQFRRWFPDPLSSVLIMSTASDLVRTAAAKETLDHDDLSKLIWPCIQAFIKSCNASKQYPGSLSKLLDAVRLDLESQIPLYLANYAALTVVSHSLKPSVYRRIHGLQVESGLDKAQSETHVRGLGSPGTGITEDLEISPDVEPRWLYALRASVKGVNRDVIIQEINKLLHSGSVGFNRGDVGALFGGFALRLFKTSNDNNVKMAVSTTKAYVFSVSIRLGGLIGHSISEFGSAQWTTLYEEALADSETPGVRRKLVRVLREFHRYLELEHLAEPINSAEIFGIGSGLVPVDANIVTDQEFESIRDRFAQGSVTALPSLTSAQDDDRLAELAWLILTLAYRCGLRRMEVLKIELMDVLHHMFPELLVRPNEYRTLKTKSSTRKLPLYALLTAEESERLKQWCQKRLEEEKNTPYSDFLFSLPKRGHKFVPQEGLFKLLHLVMREVTGDESLRFHHLRHSFASRMFVLFAVNSTKCKARVIATLPGYATAFDNADQLRRALFGESGTTRRLVWAICCLLGHSGPDVSLEHYIHHLDILLSEALAKEEIAPSTAAVIQAARKSTSQAYRHREGESLDTWAAHLFLKQLSGKSPVPAVPIGDAPLTANPNLSPLAVQEKDAEMSLYRIWNYLFDIKTSGKSIENLSQKYGVDAITLSRYSDNADLLFSLKTSDKSDIRRHRFMKWTPDIRHPESTHVIAVPVKPHEERDQKVVAQLGAQFREIFLENKHLVKKVVEKYTFESRGKFSGMIFTKPDDPCDAIDFLSFLKMLGLKNNQIKFIRYDLTSKRSKETSIWRKALGIHSSISIDTAPPIGGKKDWACPWIGIVPVFDDTDDQKMGSAGFRFVMVMAAISMPRNGVEDSRSI